ncbi:AbrB/MazE/SpoVT family DNA-binding domain-containing protein [Ciceribacter sp. L1K22]|uniref:AbrB/MazE/SpoVT family DNA-binding domain-containing protein n=1 Tax=Ciceribacter sp. L1K22 TaxID=2820275 RepID=UPI001ABE9BD9|nr:AbrB/MazE/SpoVT family DNA-binding domain-containing protein [Ciceribacter sp. L1K22]MBO3761922.1 AbrB/MazE/SpoVT family DNA-binding domain-containing protein [Ciceribacter sp. L1K22]
MGNFDSTLTSKGQTTIPVEVRDRLKLKPGDKIRYVFQGDRVYLRVKNRDALELAGFLHDPNRKPLTVEDMDQAIAEQVADEDRRIADDWDRHQRSS